jgi:hypothetical protein
MRQAWNVGMLMVGLGMLSGAAVWGADATRPGALTVAGAKELVDGGKYEAALEGIGKTLDPGNKTDYDKTAMLMLRAECELQLHKNSAAIETLEGVRKMAAAAKSRKDEAAAQAMILLIKRSPGGKYQPKTTDDKTPIDIMDRGARKGTYEALYADEMASVKQGAREAAGGTSIVPILTAAGRVYDVLSLERQTTGGSKQTAVLAVELGVTATRIIEEAENTFSRTIQNASIQSHRMVGRGARRGPAGLSASEAQSLREIVTTCQRIADAVPILRQQLDQSTILVNALARTERIRVRANAVLSGGQDTGRNLGGLPDDPPVGSHRPFSDSVSR